MRANDRSHACKISPCVDIYYRVQIDFNSHGTIGRKESGGRGFTVMDLYDVTMLKTVPVVSQDFVLMCQPLILPAIQPVSLHSQH